jgi:hypothetical protein
MTTKTYVLSPTPASVQTNKSVDLSFFNNIPWIKGTKQPKGEIGAVLSWKIDGKAVAREDAIEYRHKDTPIGVNISPSDPILYGIWELTGQFDLKNLPIGFDVQTSDVNGQFVGVVAIKNKKQPFLADGPVFVTNTNFKNVKTTTNYAQSKFESLLGLSVDLTTAAPAATPYASNPEPFKNLCDIILAETIKSYLL